jgi:hypothetical protein
MLLAFVSGMLLGQAVHVVLKDAGVTVRHRLYYLVYGSMLGSMWLVYAGLIALGSHERLALLITGLATLLTVAVVFTWQQHQRRAR